MSAHTPARQQSALGTCRPKFRHRSGFDHRKSRWSVRDKCSIIQGRSIFLPSSLSGYESGKCYCVELDSESRWSWRRTNTLTSLQSL